MSVFVDPERLLVGLARTLRQRVRPFVADASVMSSTDAAIEMVLHMLHRRLAPVPLPDRDAAAAMAAEIRHLVRDEPDAAASDRLIALLSADSSFYPKDQASYRHLIDDEGAVVGDRFDPPSEQALTTVLHAWSKDDAAEARLSGRAVGGYSKQTLFVDLHAGDGTMQQLVMRRDLPFAAGDRSSVTSEFPLLKALFKRGLPVAEPLIIEADTTVLETPFLVSRRAPGRLYGNSLGLTETADFDPEDLFGKLLAHLHAIDPTDIGIPEFAANDAGAEQQAAQIDEWTAIYRAAIDVPSAALEVGLAWLRANAHLVGGRRAIVHGDVGYHNLLIHDAAPSALVDWELAHAGSPVEDLAYVSSYIGDEAKLIDRYVAHGGSRPTGAAMAYARIYGDVRNAIYGVVAMAQFNRAVHDDVSVLPIILSSYSAYVAKIEDELSRLISAHGFKCTPEISAIA